MILPQEDMPFSKNGIVPDLIINPHAIPTRMTIGHIVETIMAKVCCMEGVIGDGSVFIPLDQEELYDNLEHHNFNRHGNEILYNGRTGRQIETEIFIGPIYYYRLKHMVADKIHSRSTGAKVQLTHQPTSGRSAGGGLRIGEMERDSLLCHGLAQFSKECMMEKSDKFKWAVCRHCGTIANYNPSRSIMNCSSCNKTQIAVIETPYTFKLLIQEMEAMGVSIRLTADAKTTMESLLTDIDVNIDNIKVIDDETNEIYSFANQEREMQELEESLKSDINDETEVNDESNESNESIESNDSNEFNEDNESNIYGGMDDTNGMSDFETESHIEPTNMYGGINNYNSDSESSIDIQSTNMYDGINNGYSSDNIDVTYGDFINTNNYIVQEQSNENKESLQNNIEMNISTNINGGGTNKSNIKVIEINNSNSSKSKKIYEDYEETNDLKIDENDNISEKDFFEDLNE